MSCSRVGFPDVGIAVLGAGDDFAGVGCDINTSDGLIVAAEGIGEGETFASRGVELDGVVAGHSQGGVILGEGMVTDWRMEEVVDGRRGHFG